MRNVATRKRILRSTVLLTLVFAGACQIPFRHSDRHPYPKKQVTAKEGTSVLIAGDARCLVPIREFVKVKVGEQHECNWRGEAAVAPAQN